jgi:Kef-type K+ transport system membrane component KefB
MRESEFHHLIKGMNNMIATIGIGTPETLGAVFLLLIIGVLIDINKGNKKDTMEKIVWTCVVILFPFIGAIIYLSVGRQEKFLYRVVNKFNHAKG